MAYIIVKPTAVIEPILPQNPTQQQQDDYDAAVLVYQQYLADLATYNTQINGIRLIASTDLVVKFTEVDLPESLIADDVYLAAVERRVLMDTGIDTADVSSQTPDIRARLVYMVQLAEAIEMIPQLPQIVRDQELRESQQVQEIDWEKHSEKLANNYKIELLIVNPSGTTSLVTPIQVFTTNTTGLVEVEPVNKEGGVQLVTMRGDF